MTNPIDTYKQSRKNRAIVIAINTMPVLFGLILTIYYITKQGYVWQPCALVTCYMIYVLYKQTLPKTVLIYPDSITISLLGKKTEIPYTQITEIDWYLLTSFGFSSISLLIRTKNRSITLNDRFIADISGLAARLDNIHLKTVTQNITVSNLCQQNMDFGDLKLLNGYLIDDYNNKLHISQYSHYTNKGIFNKNSQIVIPFNDEIYFTNETILDFLLNNLIPEYNKPYRNKQ